MPVSVCFRRIGITPTRPVSLLGYFNERISEGVLDPLYCRLAAVYDGKGKALFVQIDNCMIETADARAMKEAIAAASPFRPEETVVFANHSHTAPALTDFFESRKETEYLKELTAAVARAAGTMKPEGKAETFQCRGRAPGLASNRRWWLKTGVVATNPPRGHPLIDRPEGPVEDEVNTLLFASGDGKPLALFVSISNHTDTIGGNLVSADWTGVMEKAVQESLGSGVMVMPFVGAQGNINHFDFSAPRDQSSPAEARRIGTAYARIVLDSMEDRSPLTAAPVAVMEKTVPIPPLEVGEAEIAKARELTAQPPAVDADRQLDADDIFKGDPTVEYYFARALVDWIGRRPAAYDVPLQAVRLGDAVFCAIPGEPFVEVGLALKKRSGCALTVPMCLANGHYGYIPLKECFGRGGYETKPFSALLSRDAADRIVEEMLSLTGGGGTD